MNKSTLVMLNLVAVALILFVAGVTAGWLENIGVSAIIMGAVILIETVVLYFISFEVIDTLYNKKTPSDLRTVDDEKQWWKSKMFWLAALSFVMVVVNGVVGAEVIDQGVIEQVINLDWSNLVMALTSLVMIIIRKYFTFFPLKKG